MCFCNFLEKIDDEDVSKELAVDDPTRKVFIQFIKNIDLKPFEYEHGIRQKDDNLYKSIIALMVELSVKPHDALIVGDGLHASFVTLNEFVTAKCVELT